MRALAIGLIYFGLFLAIGFAVRRWMRRRDVELGRLGPCALGPRRAILVEGFRITHFRSSRSFR